MRGITFWTSCYDEKVAIDYADIHSRSQCLAKQFEKNRKKKIKKITANQKKISTAQKLVTSLS